MVLYIMPYKIAVFGLSDIGLVRNNNEDMWAQLEEQSFFVLADGMGGHQAGEVAATEVVNRLCDTVKKHFDANIDDEGARIFIEGAIQQVNRAIYELSFQNSEWRGMGTTLCCVLVHKNSLIYAHVGDSRIYLLREKQLRQLTQDHSLLRELIDLGQLSERDTHDFLYKNIITRAIGTEFYVDPAVEMEDVHVGDILLMCTDGLTDLLNHNEIQDIMVRSKAEKDIAKHLVKAAKERGGIDNITVVLIKIQEKNESAPHLS